MADKKDSKVAVCGKAAKGKIIHLAVWNGSGTSSGFSARCDKRMVVDLVDEPVSSVTCKKCKQLKAFKDHGGTIPPPGKKKPAPKKNTSQTKSKKTHKNKQTDPAPVKPDQISLIMDKLSKMTDSFTLINERMDNLEEQIIDDQQDKIVEESGYKDILRSGQKSNNVGKVEGKQFVAEKSGAKYRIIHVASNNIMFNNVPENVSGTVVKYLNNMKIRWENKNDPVPADFVAACATAFKAAYASHGMEVKIGKNTKDMEPPRIIKRRKPKAEKNAERKIKRRTSTSKSVDRFGFRSNTPRSDIALMLEKGIHFSDLSENLSTIYDLNEKRSRSLLKGVIRRIVKKDLPVMTVRQIDTGNDFFQIVENTTDK